MNRTLLLVAAAAAGSVLAGVLLENRPPAHAAECGHWEVRAVMAEEQLGLNRPEPLPLPEGWEPFSTAGRLVVLRRCSR